jgi:hypothetical protein
MEFIYVHRTYFLWGGYYNNLPLDQIFFLNIVRYPLLNSNQPPTKAMIVPMSVPSATARGGGESRQGMNGHVFFWGNTFCLDCRGVQKYCVFFLCFNCAILVVFFLLNCAKCCCRASVFGLGRYVFGVLKLFLFRAKCSVTIIRHR